MPLVFNKLITNIIFFVYRTFLTLGLYIIIIHCLTSDSDPYWAHADYSLYTCGEKTLFEKTP